MLTVMTDPLTSLYTMLTKGWSLTDTDLKTIGNRELDAATKVHCTTGWYDDAFLGPQVTITPVSGLEHFRAIGYGKRGEREQYDIGVWVQIDRSTGKGEGYAKKVLYAIREEILRICRVNSGGVGDVAKIDVGNWRFVPEQEADSPILHWVLTCTCEWYR